MAAKKGDKKILVSVPLMLPSNYEIIIDYESKDKKRPMQLYNGGYVYDVDFKACDGHIFWNCAQSKTKNCDARYLTFGGQYVDSQTSHNHGPVARLVPSIGTRSKYKLEPLIKFSKCKCE